MGSGLHLQRVHQHLLGGDVEVEFAALLRQDLSTAPGTDTDYIAVTNIYAADASEEGVTRSLHVSIELSAPGSVDAAQLLFDELLSQQTDETSALMTGVVSNTISQIALGCAKQSKRLMLELLKGCEADWAALAF